MGHRVVVVGGGLAGLATAHHLLQGHPGLEITVLDGGDCFGGKVRQHDVGGVRVDVGAESVVASSVAARDLFTDLGLAEQVVHPESVPAAIWSRGRRWPVPGRTFMGVPGPGSDLTGLLDEGEAARAAQPAPFVLDDEDLTVADAVGRVWGRAVVDRVVEPLLGGVYAGRVERLSLRSTMPALWAALAAGEPADRAVADRRLVDGLDAAAYAAVRAAVTDAAARTLPLEPLVAKALAGVETGAPGPRVAGAVRALLGRLEAARAALAPAVGDAEVVAGADALAVGVPPDAWR